MLALVGSYVPRNEGTKEPTLVLDYRRAPAASSTGGAKPPSVSTAISARDAIRKRICNPAAEELQGERVEVRLIDDAERVVEFGMLQLRRNRRDDRTYSTAAQ